MDEETKGGRLQASETSQGVSSRTRTRDGRPPRPRPGRRPGITDATGLPWGTPGLRGAGQRAALLGA